jgi:NifU-like protein involved in Fe-S cluster formation
MAPAQEGKVMADSDLIKLYSGRILELASDIPLTEPLAAPQGSARKRSPLCGSTVSVDVAMEDGRVTGFSQTVRACALGQAAASVVGRAILGRTEPEVVRARDQLRAMLTENGPAPDAPFDELGVLLPARDFRNRHASILLSLDAAVEAIAAARESACA